MAKKSGEKYHDSINLQNFSEFEDDGAGVSAKEIPQPVPKGVQTPISLNIEEVPEGNNPEDSPGQGDPEFLNYGLNYTIDSPLILGSPAAPMVVQIKSDPEEVAIESRNTIIKYATIIFIIILMSSSGYLMSGDGTDNRFKVKTHHLLVKDCPIRFKDIHGCDDIKQELQVIVEFLKNPRKFEEIGARMPRGYLLAGPPGVGKTLLAKAVAGEAEVPFLTISGAEFNELYVGVGSSRVRSLFEEARKMKNALIFIDEIDAIATKRGGTGVYGNETNNTLNQLLVEMDGFKTGTGIFVLAATNTPDALDSAILRPGRFDKTFVLKPPNFEGRFNHLKGLLDKVDKGVIDEDLKSEASLRTLATKTNGYTGAELDNLVNRAKLELALTENSEDKKLEMEHFDKAFTFLNNNGPKKNVNMTETEKMRKAYHKSGRIIISLENEDSNITCSEDVDKEQENFQFSEFQTQDTIQNTLDVTLAGVAAEKIYNEVNTPTGTPKPKNFSIKAGLDNKNAMKLATEIALMNDDHDEVVEAKDIIKETMGRVKAILDAKKDALKAIADKLVVGEFLTRDQLEEIINPEEIIE